MEKPKSERGVSAATGDDDAAMPPSPDRSPANSGSLGDASSSRATAIAPAPPQPSGPHAATFDARAGPDPDAIWCLVLAKFGRGRRGGGVDFSARAFVNPASGAGMVSGPGLLPPEWLPSSPQPKDQHATGAIAMEKLKSEHRDSAATGDDGADTPPPPDRSLTNSGSRATAPPQPSDPHAATLAAAFALRAVPDPDAIWSLVLAKFSRGRRGGADLAARVFFDPASGAGMATPRRVEKREGDPSDSAAAAADDAPPSPTPTPSLRKRIGIGSRTATTCSTPPPRPLELQAASAAAGSQFVGKTSEVAGESVANGNPEEQWDTLIAKWNRLKGQAWVVESEEGESMWLVDCIVNQRRLLEDKEGQLKRVAEEQQQKEDALEGKEEELKRVAEEQQQKEDALLLERVLLRERRMKQEEEEASRARRINNPRLPRRNSDEGFMGGLGAAYYADHTMRVLAVSGTNADPDLFLPLLQHGQIPAFAPIPSAAGSPSLPPTPAPTTAKPKAKDDMWNKRQLGYIFYLGLAVGLVFLLRPLLPDGYDRFLLAGFAAVWGLGSVGLPLGIFGTSRLEKNISRHIGRFISLCFSDMVIFAIYRLAVLTKDATTSATEAHPSPSPSPPPIPGFSIGLWEIVFFVIAFLVTLGHVGSWIMGYRSGGDRDLEPHEG